MNRIYDGFYSYFFGVAVMPLAFTLASLVGRRARFLGSSVRFGKLQWGPHYRKHIDPIGWMLMFKI